MKAVEDLHPADRNARVKLRTDLIRIRRLQRLSQRGLAERLGIVQAAVSDMETATRWRTPTVQRWARALDHEIVFVVAGLPVDDAPTLLDACRPSNPDAADRWDRQQLHSVLVAARQQLGVTQFDLAARIGVSESAVHAIETAGDDLTVATLQRQARGLGGSLRFKVVPVPAEAVTHAAV